ncbi:MAG: tetratricopeptide repeat protein [Anaerolineae bacterium]|nr:tetratricopeptide repeat protein [Anaerolineae bacterium]
MPIKDFWTRLTGAPAQNKTQEDELRQYLEAGDEARRNHRPDEAMRHYAEGLEQARQSGATHAQEIFLGLIGALHADQNRFEQAEEAFNEALRLADASGEVFRRARALLNLGAYNVRRGDLAKAQNLSEQALDLARKANDSATVALALGNLADVFLKQHNPSYALRLLKEAAPQALGHAQQAAYLLGRIGQAHLALNDPDQGRKYLMQAVRLAEQNNQPTQELLWSVMLADQLFREGTMEEALRSYRRAENLAEQVAILPPEYDATRVRANEAAALTQLGRSAEALDLATRVLEQARAAGDATTEGKMLTVLGSVHQALGNSDDAIAALEAALDIYTNKIKDDAERTRAMIVLGGLYQDAGQAEKALALFEEALNQAGEEDFAGRAHTLRRIGAALHKRGDWPGALEKWQQALALFDKAGEHTQMARLLCDMGMTRRMLSGLNAAMPDFERATVLLSQVRDAATRGLVLSNVANLYTDLGEVETAKSFYEEALNLARQNGQRRVESLRLGNYAWYHIMVGQPREAIRLLEQALPISRDLKDPIMIGVQTNNLAQAYHELGDYTKAEILYRQALQEIENQPDPKWAAMFRSNLGRTLVAQNRLDEAVSVLDEALKVARAVRDQEIVARTLSRLGEAYFRLGRLNEAETAAAESEGLARKWGYRKGQADALMVRASIAEVRNDQDGRIRYLREARRLYNIVHDPLADQIDEILAQVQGS